jgi:hypothetical protein
MNKSTKIKQIPINRGKSIVMIDDPIAKLKKLQSTYLPDLVQFVFAIGCAVIILGLASNGAKAYLVGLDEAHSTVISVGVVILLAYVFTLGIKKIIK